MEIYFGVNLGLFFFIPLSGFGTLTGVKQHYRY